MPDNNCFLESRLGPEEAFEPAGLLGRRSSGSEEMAEGLLQGRRALTRVGTACVAACARHFDSGRGEGAGENGERTEEAWMRLVDDGTRVPAGSLSASVHRICEYNAPLSTQHGGEAVKEEATEAAAKSKRAAVAFGAHTDATFFTLIPVASTPGLQVFAPPPPGGGGGSGEWGWCSPEHAPYRGDVSSPLAVTRRGDVLVLPGEFLEILSGGVFPCAVHRILRPPPLPLPPLRDSVAGVSPIGSKRACGQSSLPGVQGGMGGHSRRLSAPLLLRGREGEPLRRECSAATPESGAGCGSVAGGGGLLARVAEAVAATESAERKGAAKWLSGEVQCCLSHLDAWAPAGVTVTDLHRLLLVAFSEDVQRRNEEAKRAPKSPPM